MNLSASPTFRTSIEQKLLAKKCAYMLKNGSPKLRDLLRQNCRIKMKESRENAFSTSRNIPIERKQLIHKIIREELKEIDNDIELHETILKEIFESWEEWQNEEYEKESMALAGSIDENQVYCPICQKNLLTLQENIISCNCGLRLYYPKSLNEFYEIILMNIKLHEEQCKSILTFFTEPKDGFNVLGLNAFCVSCEYYSSIIN